MPSETHLEVKGSLAVFYVQLPKSVNNRNFQNSRIEVETLFVQVFKGLQCVHGNEIFVTIKNY